MTFWATVSAMRDELQIDIEILRMRAAETGNRAYEHAAAVLARGRRGRPARDDNAALAELAAILRDDPEIQVAQAAFRVARAHHPAADPEPVVKRLCRKHQSKEEGK